jgi:hypothetical protein
VKQKLISAIKSVKWKLFQEGHGVWKAIAAAVVVMN